MLIARISVTTLATIKGHRPDKAPYTSQSTMPAVKALYMPSEMPLTSRVRMVCQTCGTKDSVVRDAAA